MVSTRVRTADAGGSSAAGIAFVAAGVFCLTVNDALVKHVAAIYPVTEVVFMRMLFALPPIMVMAFMLAGPRALLTTRPMFHLVRGLLSAAAVFSFYLALTLLPLAEATAIAFSAPLFVTLLAIPLLGERPGIKQWIVTLTGFVGILLIVRPGTAAFTVAAVAPLATALSYALFMLTARMIGTAERIWTTMFYATVVPLGFSAAFLPWVWQTPELAHLPFFLGSGFFGGLGITLITQGFRIGAASVVAPFDYTGMIWAALFGWVFWNEVPSQYTILGGIVIAACGIYLAWVHSRTAKAPTVTETLPPP